MKNIFLLVLYSVRDDFIFNNLKENFTELKTDFVDFKNCKSIYTSTFLSHYTIFFGDYFNRARNTNFPAQLKDLGYKTRSYCNYAVILGYPIENSFNSSLQKYRNPSKEKMVKDLGIHHIRNWKRKHFQALLTNYRKAPFYNEYIDFFEQLYSKNWELLADLNVYLILNILQMLNLEPKSTILASDLQLSDDPSDRLIDICKTLGADSYLSGQDGIKYMNIERFRLRGIKIIVQDFKHPVYPQLFGAFQSHLSIVDLLFNCGPQSIQKIRECNSYSYTR